jgi:hypothetical protein
MLSFLKCIRDPNVSFTASILVSRPASNGRLPPPNRCDNARLIFRVRREALVGPGGSGRVIVNSAPSAAVMTGSFRAMKLAANGERELEEPRHSCTAASNQGSNEQIAAYRRPAAKCPFVGFFSMPHF